MAKKKFNTNSAADKYIQPLNVNGMKGRVLRAPATKSGGREILLLYGHHALLERWWGLVQNLQDYGTVTMPDLPGLGGMDSFYSIGKKPTLDAYADYLAAFVKLRYRRRRLTIIGVSFGFVVATRMLHRYPELVGKIDLVVSVVGFTHRNDFLYSPAKRKTISKLCRVLSTKPVAWFIRHAVLRDAIIRNIYTRMPAGKLRFKEVGAERFDELVKFETKLWQVNHVRTHWYTTSNFFTLDNCIGQINVPFYHVASNTDQYFDTSVVAQHMQIVFENYTEGLMKSVSHTPSILGNKQELAVMLPKSLRKMLEGSKPKK